MKTSAPVFFFFFCGYNAYPDSKLQCMIAVVGTQTICMLCY